MFKVEGVRGFGLEALQLPLLFVVIFCVRVNDLRFRRQGLSGSGFRITLHSPKLS